MQVYTHIINVTFGQLLETRELWLYKLTSSSCPPLIVIHAVFSMLMCKFWHCNLQDTCKCSQLFDAELNFTFCSGVMMHSPFLCSVFEEWWRSDFLMLDSWSGVCSLLFTAFIALFTLPPCPNQLPSVQAKTHTSKHSHIQHVRDATDHFTFTPRTHKPTLMLQDQMTNMFMRSFTKKFKFGHCLFTPMSCMEKERFSRTFKLLFIQWT